MKECNFTCSHFVSVCFALFCFVIWIKCVNDSKKKNVNAEKWRLSGMCMAANFPDRKIVPSFKVREAYYIIIVYWIDSRASRSHLPFCMASQFYYYCINAYTIQSQSPSDMHNTRCLGNNAKQQWPHQIAHVYSYTLEISSAGIS